MLAFGFLKFDLRDAQVSAKSPMDSSNLHRCHSRGAIKTNGFQPRGPAQKFTFSLEGCRKLQNRERHAGPEAKKTVSWPAQGLIFSGLQHPPSENANFALASKSSKSIDDSSEKLEFRPFCKIVVSVGDDTPSAKMRFLQLPTARCC